MTQESDKHQLEENSKFKDGVNKNARLMVRNISFKATEDALRAHFSKYGTVEEVKLLKKPDGRLVGCGFVHFTQVPMANKAMVATNKKPFLDRPINVTWAIPKHKYAEQIQGDNVKKPTESVLSEENASAEKKETAETKQEKKARVNRNARLIIRNVSFKATEESLQEHFKAYGDILEVKLLKKPDGKLVGCAFVHFKNVPMAKKALLNTNMKPFLGRPISVDWAVAKNVYMQHIVNQELEIQDKVKKEESDSDDDDVKLDTSNEALKEEVKGESEDESEKEGSDSESGDVKSESDDDEDEEEDSDDEKDDEEGSGESDGELDEDMEEQESQADPQERKRIKLNDAEDGCTVFLTNIPFSVDNNQLRQFAESTGPIKYALICMDRMTEHSKGSGFVKFENKEDADKFLALTADELKLEGQVMLAKPALKRENLQKDKKKEAKDNRNLYLVKEGVIVAGTKAAEGVSSSDMSKRLALERSKTQMLKNLNRFVSRYRVVVSNLPQWCEDGKLRRVCEEASGRNAVVTEARVMRDLRAPTGANGKHTSKGYGFVTFTRHEDALACLRKLNNNPDIFDRNNRPIVSFSIEDRTALNARKKRLEKSIANNPLANTQKPQEEEEKPYTADNSGNASYNNRKRKSQVGPPDESYVKKGRFNNNKNSGSFTNNKNSGSFTNNKNSGTFTNNKNSGSFTNNKNSGTFTNNKNSEGFNSNKNSGTFNRGGNRNSGKFNNRQNPQGGFFDRREQVGKFVKNPTEEEREYTGLTAKEGALHKMRNNHKLRSQAQIHKETVKRDKKKSKRALRLKRAAKERIKQPKQKINKDKAEMSRRNKNKFNKGNQ